MEVVRFRNGKYGVRRWRLLNGYQFLGTNLEHWWSNLSLAHKWGEFDSEDKAQEALIALNDKGEPV